MSFCLLAFLSVSLCLFAFFSEARQRINPQERILDAQGERSKQLEQSFGQSACSSHMAVLGRLCVYVEVMRRPDVVACVQETAGGLSRRTGRTM